MTKVSMLLIALKNSIRTLFLLASLNLPHMALVVVHCIEKDASVFAMGRGTGLQVLIKS